MLSIAFSICSSRNNINSIRDKSSMINASIPPIAAASYQPSHKRVSILFTALCAALAVVLGTVPAAAVSFDFYKLGRGVVNGDFLPDGVPGVNYFVIAGDNVSSSL